jgi:hypothetical protein
MMGSDRLRIRFGAMFMKIETLELAFLRNPQGPSRFYCIHENHRHYENSDSNAGIADELGNQLIESASVEESFDH